MATELELKRGQELFNALLRNEGLEASLLPYLDRYRKEDGENYNFSIILKYLQLYTQGPSITKEDAVRFNKLRSISKEKLLSRGKEICDTQIANNFRVTSLEPLGAKYALEDKRYLPYSQVILNRMRKAYLEVASPEYLKKYNEAVALAKRTSIQGLDFEVIKTIVGMNDVQKSLEYLKYHGISYEELKTLRNAYFQLYPEDTTSRMAIDTVEKLMLEKRNIETIEKVRIANIQRNQEKHDRKIAKIKATLISYINSDKDNLLEIVKGADYSSTKYFYEILNEEKDKGDEELKNLYEKFLAKDATFSEERMCLAKTLEDYYESGVYYGTENRRMSLYDYYKLTDRDIKEVRKILRTYLPIGKANKIGIFLGELTIAGKFSDRESFLAQLKYLFPNMDKVERDSIIDYIEEMNWPYSVKLFKDIWALLADGLITLPEKTAKNTNNLNKL